jgi:hypothetical protein
MPMLLNLKGQFWSTTWGLIITNSVHNYLTPRMGTGVLVHVEWPLHLHHVHNFLDIKYQKHKEIMYDSKHQP